MKKLLLVSFSLLIGFHALAWKTPIRYGKPSMADLKKKSYKIDTTASAIILCDYGDYYPEKFEFDHIMRVKILKKGGLHWGDWTFESMSQCVIRGKTFNLVNGKIVASKLTPKSVYQENLINGFYVTKVSMPNVKVGSVIDIEVSSPGIPLNWYFQEPIPMLYNELDMVSSPEATFKKNYFGYVPFTIDQEGRWVAQNVPAFQSEPFMAPRNNYMAHFEFDFDKLSHTWDYWGWSGEYAQLLFATSWKNISYLLSRKKEFGFIEHSSNSFFKGIADSIKRVDKTDVQKVKAALAVVHKISWTGSNNLYASSKAGLRYAFTKAAGNSADINLSLINLLRHCGIKVYPVVMRTSDRGQLSSQNPTLFHLNYVMAYAKVGKRFYLLDGTEKDLPFPFIPKKCHNGLGRVLYSVDSTGWVPLTNQIKSQSTMLYSLSLNKKQNLVGTVSRSYTGQLAYKMREKYKNLGNKKKFLSDQMKVESNLNINKDTLIHVKEISKPLVEKSFVTFKNQVIQLDSLSYLYMVPERMTENPFKLKKRLYPVDFIYPYTKSDIIVIKIPADYQIVKLPQSVRYDLPNHSGSFFFQAGADGNRISIVYRININKPVFYITEYPVLKNFFTRAIHKEAEPVILKMK